MFLDYLMRSVFRRRSLDSNFWKVTIPRLLPTPARIPFDLLLVSIEKGNTLVDNHKNNEAQHNKTMTITSTTFIPSAKSRDPKNRQVQNVTLDWFHGQIQRISEVHDVISSSPFNLDVMSLSILKTCNIM